MAVAFWSVPVSVGKPVEVQPPEGFVINLQQAALDTTDMKDGTSFCLKASTLGIESEEMEAILGTLRCGKTDQMNLGEYFNLVYIHRNNKNTFLALVFGYDVSVTFSVTSSSKSGTVHLSGYYEPAPDEEDDDEDNGDDDDEDDG
jgi:hypothetical protein